MLDEEEHLVYEDSRITSAQEKSREQGLEKVINKASKTIALNILLKALILPT